MEDQNSSAEVFNKHKSFSVIHEMIQVSQKRIKNNGVLFLIWGWAMLYNYISNFILNQIILPHHIKLIFDFIGYGVWIAVVFLNIYFVFIKRKTVKTYISISLRYVWVSLFVCLSLVNMIIFNINKEVDFELQHPIFMVLIAFATVITGGILRYKLIIAGGIAFGLLAFACSYFNIQIQLLFEAVAWLIAFVIPGHILYSKRNS